MSEQNRENGFPFDFRNLVLEDANAMEKNRNLYVEYIQVGPKRYFMPRKYMEQAADIYNMPLRASDVFIVTYPRSGTTFTSELIWLLANDLDYEKAAAMPIVQRFPFLEYSTLFVPQLEKSLNEGATNLSNSQRETLRFMLSTGPQEVAALPSPRCIKTHLPLSLLPPTLLDTTKVVYVARNPRDVSISYYNLCRLLKTVSYTGDFKTYWSLFIKDLQYWSPFFEHVKEGWEKRHHPNMLFLFYEDLVKDLENGVRRVATFLGKELSQPQVTKLCEHLNIDNFKKNKSVNESVYKELGITTAEHGRSESHQFINKGKTGGWRDYFDAEMIDQANRWIADNLRDTDLRFPE